MRSLAMSIYPNTRDNMIVVAISLGESGKRRAARFVLSVFFLFFSSSASAREAAELCAFNERASAAPSCFRNYAITHYLRVIASIISPSARNVSRSLTRMRAFYRPVPRAFAISGASADNPRV